MVGSKKECTTFADRIKQKVHLGDNYGFNRAEYKTSQSKSEGCCPDVISSNILDAPYIGEQRIMNSKQELNEGKKKRKISDKEGEREHSYIPNSVISSSEKPIIRSMQPIKGKEIEMDKEKENDEEVEIARAQQLIKNGKMDSNRRKDKCEAQQPLKNEANDSIKKKSKDKDKDGGKETGASSTRSYHPCQSKTNSSVQESKTSEMSRKASSRRMLEEYEKGEAERRLETRLFLKRLTWKRGQLREKTQLANLKIIFHKLKKENIEKIEENKFLRQLIKKLKSKSMKDSATKNEMSLLMQLNAIGRKSISQEPSKEQLILLLQQQLRQQQRNSNQYASQLRQAGTLINNPNALNPLFMLANQSLLAPQISHLDDNLLKANLLYLDQIKQRISGMPVYSYLNDSKINNPIGTFAPAIPPSVYHVMPSVIELAQNKIDMVKMLSLFTDKHVLFGAFAKTVNDLQWEHYYRNNNAYYHILDDWLRAWPPVAEYNNNAPLCSFGYNGSPILPYSAFGESGYHHGIQMTKNHAKTLFLLIESQNSREKYIKNSFQAWHDDGMTVDDTHKITKKVFVNTTGKTRVRPFTAVMTVLNKLGKIVSSRYKYSKGHNETKAILLGIKEIRDHQNTGPLKYLSLDNPVGDAPPFNEVFKELEEGTTPYKKSGSLPKMYIPKDNIMFFNSFEILDNYMLSVLEELDIASKKYGLDTEFDIKSKELTILSLSYSNLPIIVISLYCIKKLPIVVRTMLERDDFIACGRSIGQDCNLLYDQYSIMIKNRIEIGTLALVHDPSLKQISGGTGVAFLTEKYLGMRIPVEKSIGQCATYATKDLSEDLQLYAACDALCHRIITEEIEKIIYKTQDNNLKNTYVLNVGSYVQVVNRGIPVLEGCVTFHGLLGAQSKFGCLTLGRNDVKVKVEKILKGNFQPNKRSHKLWPDDKKTLIDLWDSVDNLEIITKPGNLSIIMQNKRLQNDTTDQFGNSKTEQIFSLVKEDNTTLTEISKKQEKSPNNKACENVLNLTNIQETSHKIDEQEQEEELHEKDRMYTRAIRDIFHEFHNLKLPKNCPATIQIFHLVQMATWINNDEDYDAVVETLLDKGVKDITKHQFFNRSYWRKRLRRGTPIPSLHSANIKLIYNQLSNDKNFEKILTPAVKEWFHKFQENAEQGLYQLPDDVFHYTLIGTDSDGLNLYRSEIGTNMNENLHQKYADLVGPFAVGIKIGHILTALRSYRYNISVGIGICGEPDFGTDQHEVVDMTQKWLMKIFGIFAWPAHKNLLDFDATNFISVGIGPLPLNEEHVKGGKPEITLSNDYKYMCNNMDVQLAPLPISTIAERKMFNDFVNTISCQKNLPKFDDYNKLAINYLNHSNGKDIFPKTITMLQKHYKKWRINTEIKNFQIRIKKNYESILAELSKQRVQPPKTRVFSIKDNMPPKITDIAPVKSLIKNEEHDNSLKQPILNYKSMGMPCIRWPLCLHQRGQCGGTTKMKCMFYDTYSPDHPKNINKKTKEECTNKKNELKKKRKSLLQKTSRVISNPPQKIINLVNSSSYTFGDRIFIESTKYSRKGCGGIVVEPADILHLLDTGYMITDNIVNGYMNLLVNSVEFPLKVVTTHFLLLLKNYGWQTAAKKLEDWNNIFLLFIPGFRGPNEAGHWFNIIVDRQPDNKLIIFVADSLGDSNFNEIKKLFKYTPLDDSILNNTWKYIYGPKQAYSSNDCAVFMTHIFASYILFKLKYFKISDIKSFILKESSHIFGIKGRRHLFKSIIDKDINYHSESITSIYYEIESTRNDINNQVRI